MDQVETTPAKRETKPASVIHLIGSLDRGGAEMVALDLCRTIPSETVSQHFVCLSGREGSLSREFREQNATVSVLPIKPLPSFARAFMGMLRHERPDVVTSHVSLSSAFILLLAKVTGVPTRIARMHSDGDGKPSTALRRIYRYTCRCILGAASTHVLAVSPAALRFAVGATGLIAWSTRTRLRVLPNGVDCAKFHIAAEEQRDQERAVIMHVGRGSAEKRRYLLPQIQRHLAPFADNVFICVGGENASDIGDIDPGSFYILGDRNDVPALLRGADALVLPSTREGLPGVVLEALASGLPVVASALPGLQYIAKQVDGVRVLDVDSSPDAWAQAILSAVQSTPDERLAIRASLVSSPFTLSRSAQAWMEIWTAPIPRGSRGKLWLHTNYSEPDPV